jgi:hypothetical protein
MIATNFSFIQVILHNSWNFSQRFDTQLVSTRWACMGIPVKMFRDAATAKMVLVSAARHGVFQYVIANQTVEILIYYRLESLVIVSEWIICCHTLYSPYKGSYILTETSSYKQP